MAPALRRRLAIAAPLMQLTVMSALLALAARPADLLTPALVVVLAVPAILGVWVFGGRPLLHRLLLGAWAPAGAVVLFFAILFALRFVSRGSELFFWGIVGVPLAALLVLGLVKLRGAGRPSWILTLMLWTLALTETVIAIPLSERFGVVGDMHSLAGTLLLLFGPGIALGAWGGLALAARVPEGVPTDAVQSEDALVSIVPGDAALDQEMS